MKYVLPLLLTLVLALTACNPTINLEVNIDSTAVAMLATIEADRAMMTTDGDFATPEPPAATEIVSDTPWQETTLDSGDILYEFEADGFSIALPEAWEVVDMDGDAFADMLGVIGEQNQALESVFTSDYFQQLASAGIRFYALNTNPDSLQSDTPMNINILKQELPFPFELDEYVALNVSQLEQVFDLKTEITEVPVQFGDTEATAISYTAAIIGPFGNPLELRNTQYLMIQDDIATIITVGMTTNLVDDYLETTLQSIESFRLTE